MYNSGKANGRKYPQKDAKTIFIDACSILVKIDGLTSISDYGIPISACFANGESFKSISKSMISKIVQLQRKHKEVEILDHLIESYGHRARSSTKSNFHTNNENDDYGTLAYCIIMMCIHDWVLHKVSTNEAINRVIKVLRYLKSQNDDLCIAVNNLMLESELPFKTGGEYSRFLNYFPSYSSEDIPSNDKLDGDKYMEIFPKTEGMQFKDNLFTEKIEALRASGSSWKDFSENEQNDIKEAVREMLWRNQAIFLMLFLQLHGSLRLRYSRESDRIISSEYFRYLQYKSQVMFNNASDDQRTRLTHTLEVAHVAKTIAKQLGCNWELVEAMSLGHDLGHMPFAHQGEAALDDCLNKAWAGRFSHSLQSVKILGSLARHATVYDKFGVSGLCLSRPVLEGILKHDTDVLLDDIRSASWRLQYNEWREVLIRDKLVKVEIKGEVKPETDEPEWIYGLTIGGLETQIVYWADKIANIGHDWDDFVKSGLVEQMTLDIEHILKRMHQLRHMAHAEDGIQQYKISDIKSQIKNEIELIRFIRFHIGEIRKSLNNKKYTTEEGRIVATFKASKKVVMFGDMKLKVSSNDYLPFTKNTKGALARFVHGLLLWKKHYDDNPEQRFTLRYFTISEYKLLLDFFTVAHDLIYLTDIFPKPYKKNDDVVRVIFRYLIEIDKRHIVRALHPKLTQCSRNLLAKSKLDRDGVIKEGRKAIFSEVGVDVSSFPDYLQDAKSLHDVRVTASIREYSGDEANASLEDRIKTKKGFMENLQKKMLIRLDNDIIYAHNRIRDFVHEYYIGSERVRIMKHKSHKIINELFDFFMTHEDMLPTEYKHRIALDAQRISRLSDTFADVEGERLLVVQYVFERMRNIKNFSKFLENIKKDDTNISLLDDEKLIPQGVPKKMLFQIFKAYASSGVNNSYDIIKKSIDDPKLSREDFAELCKHIAKARVIADYIATMTDRYAEKKYNEIVSSGTSWSITFHE